MCEKAPYKELGLSNSREMFRRAMEGQYSIPGYNFNNMEQLQAILIACVETQSPVILQVSSGARQYANETLLRFMAMGGVQMMKEMAKEKNLKEIPIVLHLDHGSTFELCKSCIDMGFSSVMFDGSALSYEENIRITNQVVEYAHKYDVVVEAELGVLAGIEDEVCAEKSTYTRPEEVVDFVTRTNCDSLAISIGTSHGPNKFSVDQCIKNEDGIYVPPALKFDVLSAIEKELPGFPIVLHGSSSVPTEAVRIINEYGGKLKNPIGIPEEQLRKASKSAVCKINIDTDGRMWMTAMCRKVFVEKPGEIDPRKYLGPARSALIEMYKHKNESVLGCAGKV